MKKRIKLDPVHPGEVLSQEFLQPLEMTQASLAHQIGVPTSQLSRVVRGKQAVTASLALRLARFFGTTPQFWLGLQMHYDLDIAQDQMSDRINREVRRHSASAH